MASAVEGFKRPSCELDAVKLNIAVTGEFGSGKSSFVNALRGLGDEDEQSAPTGVVETTMEPTPYPHPKHPNITIWDLPGIGHPNFKAEEYLERIKFERYDLFILIASLCFTNNSVDLAKKIKKSLKYIYFVRSKIDESIRAEKRKKDFDQEKVLTQIRRDCEQRLEQSGVESPEVFLISSHELGNYDFSHLMETMERDNLGGSIPARVVAFTTVSSNARFEATQLSVLERNLQTLE